MDNPGPSTSDTTGNESTSSVGGENVRKRKRSENSGITGRPHSAVIGAATYLKDVANANNTLNMLMGGARKSWMTTSTCSTPLTTMPVRPRPSISVATSPPRRRGRPPSVRTDRNDTNSNIHIRTPTAATPVTLSKPDPPAPVVHTGTASLPSPAPTQSPSPAALSPATLKARDICTSTASGSTVSVAATTPIVARTSPETIAIDLPAITPVNAGANEGDMQNKNSSPFGYVHIASFDMPDANIQINRPLGEIESLLQSLPPTEEVREKVLAELKYVEWATRVHTKQANFEASSYISMLQRKSKAIEGTFSRNSHAESSNEQSNLQRNETNAASPTIQQLDTAMEVVSPVQSVRRISLEPQELRPTEPISRPQVRLASREPAQSIEQRPELRPADQLQSRSSLQLATPPQPAPGPVSPQVQNQQQCHNQPPQSYHLHQQQDQLQNYHQQQHLQQHQQQIHQQQLCQQEFHRQQHHQQLLPQQQQQQQQQQLYQQQQQQQFLQPQQFQQPQQQQPSHQQQYQYQQNTHPQQQQIMPMLGERYYQVQQTPNPAQLPTGQNIMLVQSQRSFSSPIHGQHGQNIQTSSAHVLHIDTQERSSRRSLNQVIAPAAPQSHKDNRRNTLSPASSLHQRPPPNIFVVPSNVSTDASPQRATNGFYEDIYNRLDFSMRTFSSSLNEHDHRRITALKYAIKTKDDCYLLLHNLFMTASDPSEITKVQNLQQVLSMEDYQRGLRRLDDLISPNSSLSNNAREVFKHIPCTLSDGIRGGVWMEEGLGFVLDLLKSLESKWNELLRICRSTGSPEPTDVHFEVVRLQSPTLGGIFRPRIRSILAEEAASLHMRNNAVTTQFLGLQMTSPLQSPILNFQGQEMFPNHTNHNGQSTIWQARQPQAMPPPANLNVVPDVQQHLNPRRIGSGPNTPTWTENQMMDVSATGGPTTYRRSSVGGVAANTLRAAGHSSAPPVQASQQETKIVRPEFLPVTTETGTKIPGWKIALETHLLDPTYIPYEGFRTGDLFLSRSALIFGQPLHNKELHKIAFEVPDQLLPRVARSIPNQSRGPGEPHNVRFIRPGSLCYRVRCFKMDGGTNIDSIRANWNTKETYWPTSAFFEINGKDLELRRKKKWVKDQSLDITDYLQKENTLSFVFHGDLLPVDETIFLSIEVLEVTSKISILEACSEPPQKCSALDVIRSRLKNLDNNEGDVSIVNGDVTIGIVCPISLVPFSADSLPVRGKACSHLECFDLKAFLESRPRYTSNGVAVTDAWNCPICSTSDCRPQSLVQDTFLADVVKKLSDDKKLDGDATSITVWEDGRWELKPRSSNTVVKKDIEVICLDDD